MCILVSLFSILMFKKPKQRKYLPLFIVFFLILAGLLIVYLTQFGNKINGLFLLSENTGDIAGYYKWEEVLDQKSFKAIIKPERAVLEKYPDYFKNLAAKGYEVATGYGEAPFWDMPYEKQYSIMKEYKEYAEAVLGKPIKLFSSKYFAYDENTLKAADALNIPYILGRGTGVEVVVYSPKEYKTQIILVSNLVFEDMGSGSLCDASLYQRGSTAEDFEKVLDESFAQKPKDLVLVSHVYIGGTRIGWWDAYEKAINTKKVNWNSFDEWIDKVHKTVLPYAEIPYNTEVKYLVPKPSTPLEEIELIPELKNKEIRVFHNGQGAMCLEFLEFIKTIDYPVTQYLTSQDNFYPLLEGQKSKFSKSEGVSEEFGYFPIIFINDKAYSGFNAEIRQNILNEISKK